MACLSLSLFSLSLSISSSWPNLRLHTDNQIYTLPGSSLKVWVVGVESEFSDRLWLELSLGQAEQYHLQSSNIIDVFINVLKLCFV